MSSSNLSRNKLTVPVGLSTPKNNRLRSELRRVMSDRVLKITRCSQQQNVEKIKQRLDSSSTATPPSLGPSTPSMSQTTTTTTTTTTNVVTTAAISSDIIRSSLTKQNKSPLVSPSSSTIVLNAKKIPMNMTSPANCNNLSQALSSPNISASNLIQNTSNISPTNSSNDSNNNNNNINTKSNKISLQPFKIFDIKDKEGLIKHVQSAYDDVLVSNGSLILTVQSIVNSIVHYTKSNNLDYKSFLVEILKEKLFQTNIYLKQKYKNDEQNEKFKLEGQIQVLLQIENYIVSNISINSNKVRVDEDWVWEIANTIRWLKQTFKDFKIEKFLFGEIYANYFQTASDFILSLMEELGYDKDDNNDSNSNSSNNSSPIKNNINNNSASSHLNDSNNEQKQIITLSQTTAASVNPLPKLFLSQLTHSNSNPALSFLREDSNSNYSFTGGVNSLFEDEYPERNNNDSDLNEYDDQSQNTNFDDGDKLLPDLKKKKNVTRFSDFSQSAVRSIVVQRKKTRLKMRSPYKSPSKNLQNRRLVVMTNENSRKSSPRIKEKPTFSVDTSTSQKRPRTYLITDTPDHKQNATIITTRQEKLRKRFSFQQFNSPNTSLPPIVPDTPVKSENRNTIQEESGTASLLINKPTIGLSLQSMYASPKKNILFR